MVNQRESHGGKYVPKLARCEDVALGRLRRSRRVRVADHDALSMEGLAVIHIQPPVAVQEGGYERPNARLDLELGLDSGSDCKRG